MVVLLATWRDTRSSERQAPGLRPLSALTNAELGERTLAYVNRLREFLGRTAWQHQVVLLRAMARVPNLRTDAQRDQAWFRSVVEHTAIESAAQTEFNIRFRLEGVLIWNEVRRRVAHEHWRGLQPTAFTLPDELERLARKFLLPGAAPSKRARTEN